MTPGHCKKRSQDQPPIVALIQDIGCTLRGELSGSDRKHVGLTTEAIVEQQDVGVASWCDRKGAEVVNTDGDTWTFR